AGVWYQSTGAAGIDCTVDHYNRTRSADRIGNAYPGCPANCEVAGYVDIAGYRQIAAACPVGIAVQADIGREGSDKTVRTLPLTAIVVDIVGIGVCCHAGNMGAPV